MNPQCERILRYLDEHGSITQMEATAELGIIRLPSRIHELRRDGYDIPKEFESGKNRYGETVHYARYRNGGKKGCPLQKQN